MPRDVKLNELSELLGPFEYPVDQATLQDDLGDVTLVYADGEEALSAVLDRIDDDVFDSMDDLETAIFNELPVEAVGEPGQSEGEG